MGEEDEMDWAPHRATEVRGPSVRQQPGKARNQDPIIECVEEGLEFEEDEEEAEVGLKRWVPDTFGIGTTGVGFRRAQGTRIAPVGIGSVQAGNPAIMPMFRDPVLMQVMRNLTQPFF